MPAGEPHKRRRPDGYNRRHDRNKFRKTTSATVHKKGLGSGLRGILFSCTPRQEDRAYRDAVILLGEHCENNSNEEPKEKTVSETKDVKDGAGNVKAGDFAVEKKEEVEGGNGEGVDMDISKALQEELTTIRQPGEKLFTRVDGGVTGSVFVCVNRADIDLEVVVEAALRDARASGSPNSKHCIRIMPIHATCYAKKEEVAKAAVEVVKSHFPKFGEDGTKEISYAIAFKARLNSGARREDFIDEIASSIQELEPRYKVNLTQPDVSLIVEVIKTSCCIGTFRHYFELAKMNLREAACPTKPKEQNKGGEEDRNGGAEETNKKTNDVTEESNVGIENSPKELSKEEKTESEGVSTGGAASTVGAERREKETKLEAGEGKEGVEKALKELPEKGKGNEEASNGGKEKAEKVNIEEGGVVNAGVGIVEEEEEQQDVEEGEVMEEKLVQGETIREEESNDTEVKKDLHSVNGKSETIVTVEKGEKQAEGIRATETGEMGPALPQSEGKEGYIVDLDDNRKVGEVETKEEVAGVVGAMENTER